MPKHFSRGYALKDIKTPTKTATAADDGATGLTEAWSLLTAAEWRLVLLATSGGNDREIARATGKTQAQVKEEFEALLDKLGLADRLTLILASFAYGSRMQSQILRSRLQSWKEGVQAHAERSS